MSPYLLVGYLTAGLIHAFVPTEVIYKHLSGRDFKSILKATLFGIPLPLCSCGVLPVAEHLKREGASKGSIVSFLLSTPTTGVDSILATYSLLRLPITVLRILAATTAGLLSGFLTNLLSKEEENIEASPQSCCCCTGSSCSTHETPTKVDRLKEAIKYGFSTLTASTRKWILLGVLLGGVIATLLPQGVVNFLTTHNLSYVAVLVIAMSMYVCATGSIPIAAALVSKGFPPGSVIIFLIAGPATNTVSIAFIKGRLGSKTLVLYLLTIVIVSVLFALIADALLANQSWKITVTQGGIAQTFKHLCAVLLLILFAFAGKW